MSNEFLKTLLASKVPRVHTAEHQKKLKKALLNQPCFSRSERGSVWERFTLFSDLKNMSFKKWIPATLVAMFVLGLVGQNYKISQNTAYAQALVDQTLEQVKNTFVQVDGEEKPLLSDLELLPTKEVKIWVKDGKLANLKEIQDDLGNSNVSDELLAREIQNENQNFVRGFSDGFSENDEVTPEMVEEMKTIIQSSPLPVQSAFWVNLSDSEKKTLSQDDPRNIKSRTNEKGELFVGILYFYALGEAPTKTPDTQTLDKLIEEIRTSTYHPEDKEEEIRSMASEEQSKKAKIQFLEDLKQAKDLKYEGQVTLENGEKAEKVSFTQNGQRMEVIFGGNGSEYKIVE